MGKGITFLDKTFWITESKDNTKHVACLQILERPENAPQDYLEHLIVETRKVNHAIFPLNSKVKSLWRYPLKLVEVPELDMQYHVQHHYIEDVHDKSLMHAFVAQLHDEMLDRDKPLWQYHVISDTKSREFAIYLKIHHMYGDGATLVKWFQHGYLPHPTTDDFVPAWAAPKPEKKRKPVSRWYRYWQAAWDFINIIKDMTWVFFRLFLRLVRLNTHYMPVPFTGTKTQLTGQVKSGRAVTTVELDFDRVKALGKRARASANEILLCAFDIAVHRFLKDYGQRFDKALKTNVPINLRLPGDQSAGNKIAIVPVELAHGETDPYLRLRQIIANHRIVKNAAQKARPGSFSYYTIVIQSFALIFEMLHLSDWIKPIANILISNVPGPSDERYLRDSKLLSCYPVSTMTPGGGVNITFLTYKGKANIGMVCCNKNVSSLDPLADYFLEAFDMLERCIDDPTLNIDDIGERTMDTIQSIVTDPSAEPHAEEEGEHHPESHSDSQPDNQAEPNSKAEEKVKEVS